jgi:hypothetical protein
MHPPNGGRAFLFLPSLLEDFGELSRAAEGPGVWGAFEPGARAELQPGGMLYDAYRTPEQILTLAPAIGFVTQKKRSGTTRPFVGRVNLDNARAEQKSNIPAARRPGPCGSVASRTRRPNHLAPTDRPAKAVRSPTRRLNPAHHRGDSGVSARKSPARSLAARSTSDGFAPTQNRFRSAKLRRKSVCAPGAKPAANPGPKSGANAAQIEIDSRGPSCERAPLSSNDDRREAANAACDGASTFLTGKSPRMCESSADVAPAAAASALSR